MEGEQTQRNRTKEHEQTQGNITREDEQTQGNRTKINETIEEIRKATTKAIFLKDRRRNKQRIDNT